MFFQVCTLPVVPPFKFQDVSVVTGAKKMSGQYSSSNFAEKLVKQKGSGYHVIIGVLVLIIGLAIGMATSNNLITYGTLVIGVSLIISAFLMIINQYERAVILRLGKYQRQVGPGIQTRLPFADNILVIDIREKVSEFKAERMLTKDNVPVTIDAILRYKIIDERAKDAILNVENFNQMIQQVSQTTLRNNIGSSQFQDVLSKREEINQHVKTIISAEASSWGIEVTGVEIRQVIIPQELESAMSMQAQAEREKSARVTYGESEILVAKKFEEAARVYADNPVAYALRQSNMLYESIKVQGNTIVMIPSESLNAMGFGNLGTTIAYLESTKKAVTQQKSKDSQANQENGSL
ncbi:Membrane protease subunit, stomatin/prohibitin (modular protein) [Candidatus Nitrosotalea okcheonensis]|uniref:Membrane protease subunit, stomatin/prohibitin (Modular protein) n=2 Tax=Candidatus Nitrosotalea okcheonensis TaxID=1903276 RepID=A0A2H1FDW9_9ARCH|nr:Membrane protease subunit, stomatin/prohibitin (modular protein) [Candidatus Nitrosotalea okcheonensis]